MPPKEYFISSIPLDHSQSHRSSNTQAHNGPPCPHHLLIRQLRARIPHQMPDPVEAVKCERHCDSHLHQYLCGDGPRSKGGRYARTIQVPSKQRSAEVCGTEDVEPAAENRAGYTVECGEIPRDLGFVDRQVRGDGTVAALLFEDRVGGRVFDSLGCGGSGFVSWICKGNEG